MQFITDSFKKWLFAWVFYWQCHICKVFINFLLEKCFSPEAIDLETVALWWSWEPHPLHYLGPHPLFLSKSDLEKRVKTPGGPRSPHQSGNKLCLVQVLSHWRRRWVRLLKFLARRSCHSGARQLERLCLACQCSQQPRDYCRQEQWCPQAEASLSSSTGDHSALRARALEKTLNFQLLQLCCESVSNLPQPQ